ncbi:MAG: hypothetical protein AAGA58_09300 [Verrucomicrobiota bacterium]
MRRIHSFNPTLRAGILAIAALVGLSSCNLFAPYPPEKTSDHRAVVPSDFLFSWDKDYNHWMDTPVRILYDNVPLSEVFTRHPFTRLVYDLQSLPPEMPLVTTDHLGISRRQYLWSLAHTYNLRMSLRTTSSGEPETVLIRWREAIDKTGGSTAKDLKY